MGEEAHGRRVGDLEQRHRAEAGRLAEGEDAVAQRAAGLGEDERPAAQAGDVAGELLPRRGDRPERLLAQRRGHDAVGRRAVAAGHADVGRAARHQRADLRRRRLAERDLQAGMRAVERRERREQARRLGRRRDRADAPARDARVAVEVGPRAGELREHRLGARQQLLAGGRQLGAARRPPQQLDAELGLEPPDLLRQRRLGDPELLRRAREAAVARDRGEVLQPPQLHALSAPSSRRP